METPEQQERVVMHMREALSIIPPDAPTAVVLRHADRPEKPSGSDDPDLPLKVIGERHSEELGDVVRGRVSLVLHSPYRRCGQSADWIASASGCESVEANIGLQGDVFVKDADRSSETRVWHKHGCTYDEYVTRLATSDKPLFPGYPRPIERVAKLASWLLGGRMRIGVSHSWMVEVAVSHVRGRPFGRDDFVGYLDAVLIWKNGGSHHYYFKGEHGLCAPVFQEELSRALSPDR